MPRPARTYRLTADIIASHGGGPVVCLAPRAEGMTFRLRAERPGPETNTTVFGATGEPDLSEVSPVEARVTRVVVSGPLETRAGYHDVCGGWTDGHDAIAERMIAAFADGDVLMVFQDCPGGAAMGTVDNVARVVAEKKRLNRRVTAWVDGYCFSGGYWWAACVADETFLSVDGVIGSVGARSTWTGIAGALAKEGVERRHFTWPGDGKVAFADDMPLSGVALARGDRDVALCGEMFAAAVGPRRGLSREEIVKLNADCLTGQAAVDAKLADGVSTYEEVTAYALAMANEEHMPEEDVKKKAAGEEMPPEETEEGEMPPEETEEGEEEVPPSAPAAKPAARSTSPSASRSLAALAGLPEGASVVAIKTALAPLVGLAQHVMSVTETNTPAGARGALSALAADAAAAGKLRTEKTALAKKEMARERMDQLGKLVAIGAATPGEVYRHDDEGRVVGPSKAYGPGPEGRSLANLKGEVAMKSKNAGSAPRRTPFEPDRAAAEGQVIHASANKPAVKQLANQLGIDPEKVAASAANVDRFISQQHANGAR